MKSVVKSVVTLKSVLSIRYHCETLINWGKRVDFLPLYITNSRNCEYSQILTPIFLVTTEVTTFLANFILGGNYHERDQLYPEESCTPANGVPVRKFRYMNGERSLLRITLFCSMKGASMTNNKTNLSNKTGFVLVKEDNIYQGLYFHWTAWSTIFLKARDYAWEPTEAVEPYSLRKVEAEKRQASSGGYASCDGQPLTPEDAKGLCKALRKALKEDHLYGDVKEDLNAFLEFCQGKAFWICWV